MERPVKEDAIDRGCSQTETDDMRRKREALVAASPPPQFFKLRAQCFTVRAQLRAQGRSNATLADTGNLYVNLKVYAGGGENGLHNHSDEDHFHLVLGGGACFYGPRGEERVLGPYEGIMLPAGSYYRFQAIGDEPLILLRVGCKAGPPAPHRRYNVYGEPLPSESKENGRVEMIPRPEAFWGAPE
jgi:mannose-6-phosphate isomerase-like protein (cupin superfamily)